MRKFLMLLAFIFAAPALQATQPYQMKVDEIMKAKKYGKKNWQTLKFEGEDHSEKSWAKRLSIPLAFMLK